VLKHIALSIALMRRIEQKMTIIATKFLLAFQILKSVPSKRSNDLHQFNVDLGKLKTGGLTDWTTEVA